MIEKRRFLRFPISLRTILFTFEDGSRAEVQTDNVSREGVGLQIERQDFQQGAVVKMSLYLEPDKAPIDFTGKIAWASCEENAKKVGVEILQIDPAQKNEILEKAYKTWLNQDNKKDIL